MADALFSNLASSWGVETDEPDPARFGGLLQLAESALEKSVAELHELRPHFQEIQGKILASLNDLENITSRDEDAPDPVMEAVGEAAEAFEDVDGAIASLLELTLEHSPDEHWEVLGEFEAAVESLEQACQALAQKTRQ